MQYLFMGSHTNIPESPEIKSHPSSLFIPLDGCFQKDLLILADRPWDVLEIDSAVHLTIDGYALIWKLIRNPLTEKDTVLKR